MAYSNDKHVLIVDKSCYKLVSFLWISYVIVFIHSLSGGENKGYPRFYT